MPVPVSVQPQVSTLAMISSLKEHEVKLLVDQLDYHSLSMGEVLFEEGTTGDQCFLIVSGSMIISKRLDTGRDQALATLERGELLGQIALIDRKPRSATCRAGSAGATLVSLSVDTFESLYNAQSPFAFKIIDHIVTDLSKRLRGANSQLSKARETQDHQQRQKLSLKAAQVIAGHRYTDEELDTIEVIKTEFEQGMRYGR